MARFLVYPKVQITATPPEVNAAVDGEIRALRPRESGCGTFRFEVEGKLPHASRPTYSIRAFVDLKSPNPVLHGVQLTLDNLPLDYSYSPMPGGDWYIGRSLSREELLGDHVLCVRTRKSRGADPAKPIEIPVAFSLIEVPYDTQKAITPASLKASLIPVSFFEDIAIWLAAVVTAAAILCLAWYGRLSDGLPHGLKLAFEADSSGLPDYAELVPVNMPLHLLGLRRKYRMAADHGMTTLGQIEPIREDLFRVVPSPQVTITTSTSGEEVIRDGLLSARRTYLAKTGSKQYRFRLEYS
jgi:hypothetical protein